MGRFDGLENDVSYIRYNDIKKRLTEWLNDDERSIDVQYFSILLEILEHNKILLDSIKEFRRGEDDGEC